MKALIQKDICTHMLTAALFITAKKQKQPKCPLTDGYSDVVHTHTHTHTYISSKECKFKLPILSFKVLG